MRREIIFPAGTWCALNTHLLGQGQTEQLAFLLAGVARGRGWVRLLVREIIPVPSEAFEQQTYAYLAVGSAYSRAILRRCYEDGLSLIEAHSHPFADRNVTFSNTDVANEAEKFRYVARKIPHICHATIVVGRTNLDCHLWDRRRRCVAPIDRVRLLDAPVTDLVPTSSSRVDGHDAKLAPWLDRQVLAFGEEGQRRLQAVRVGIVGCGGTGAAVVQMLAHLGVRNLVLVDPDVVEVTNLNRLVGASQADARRRRFKVRVARRLARRINPEARVRVLPLSIVDSRAVAALKGMDLLFGCTDNHGSRLLLNQLAVQYLIPYLDLGAGLRAAPNGKLVAAGGQVRLIQPGKSCLACIGGIDRVQAARDLMAPMAWQRQVTRGYVQGADLPTPAVLFLNNAVASLAMAEFVSLWTGYRASMPLVYFDLLRSRLTPAEANRKTSCVACGEGGSLGLGDLEILLDVGCGFPSDTVPLSGSRRR